MSSEPSDLARRLHEAGSTGLDLSPGDPLCREALEEIERLRAGLADLERERDYYREAGIETQRERDEVLAELDERNAALRHFSKENELQRLRAENERLRANWQGVENIGIVDLRDRLAKVEVQLLTALRGVGDWGSPSKFRAVEKAYSIARGEETS